MCFLLFLFQIHNEAQSIPNQVCNFNLILIGDKDFLKCPVFYFYVGYVIISCTQKNRFRDLNNLF